jgi:hypothetical protein
MSQKKLRIVNNTDEINYNESKSVNLISQKDSLCYWDGPYAEVWANGNAEVSVSQFSKEICLYTKVLDEFDVYWTRTEQFDTEDMYAFGLNGDTGKIAFISKNAPYGIYSSNTTDGIYWQACNQGGPYGNMRPLNDYARVTDNAIYYNNIESIKEKTIAVNGYSKIKHCHEISAGSGHLQLTKLNLNGIENAWFSDSCPNLTDINLTVNSDFVGVDTSFSGCSNLTAIHLNRKLSDIPYYLQNLNITLICLDGTYTPQTGN